MTQVLRHVDRSSLVAQGRTHGLAGTYTSGCRCDDCRAAWADESRVRNRARGRALQRLLNAHRREYLRYYAEEAAPFDIRVGQPGRRRA